MGAYSIIISTIFIMISFNPSKAFLIELVFFGDERTRAIPKRTAKNIIWSIFLLLLAELKKLSGTTSTIIWSGPESSTSFALDIFIDASEAYFSLSSVVLSSGKYSPGCNVFARIKAITIADIVVIIYIPKVLLPILDNFEVSLKLEIPDTKETKIKGTATSFNIFTNIVPKGIIQSDINSPIPIKTDVIPTIKPKTKPRIIFEWRAILLFTL